MQDVFWPGVASMAAMYVAVFLVGVFATRAAPKQKEDATLTEIMLAGRSLPLWVGLLTMTATWVGGGYINGTAEYTYSSGLLWGAQAGIGYALSLLIGGLFYARVMRRHAYATLIDPLEARFGRGTAGLLMLPAVLAEVFWSAAILVALGTTFGTIVGIDHRLSIMVSATVAIAYTVFGGLRAVAYTDVIQMFLIVIGLGIAVPYAIGATSLGESTGVDWSSAAVGFGSAHEAWSYADWSVILILGGIPWNVYFQRVLASRDGNVAARTSMAAGVLCLLMAVPPLLLGLSGRSIDWAALPAVADGALGGAAAVEASLAETPALVLPFILRLAVPPWVSVVALGAVAAAVMSSVDSSILSASSLVAWNGYKRLLRPEATNREVTWLIRVLVVVLGAGATAIALSVGSVAALWYLCGDVVYCVLFPQLSLALFDKKATRTGALAGFTVSTFLRLGGGDTTLGLPAFLPYPDWGVDYAFPFRTVAMVSGLVVAVVVSRLAASWDAPRPLSPLDDI